MAKRRKAKEPERFVRLTYKMLNHENWQNLSISARYLYVEFKKIFNGRNNGEIAMSVRSASKKLRCGKDKAAGALRELEIYGFISAGIRGRYPNKFASTWSLTEHDLESKPAANVWLQKCTTSVPKARQRDRVSSKKDDGLSPLSIG